MNRTDLSVDEIAFLNMAREVSFIYYEEPWPVPYTFKLTGFAVLALFLLGLFVTDFIGLKPLAVA